MKPIYYLLASFILILSSCGVISDEFSRQKYTGFKRGGGSQVVVKQTVKPHAGVKTPEQQVLTSQEIVVSDVDAPTSKDIVAPEVSKVEHAKGSEFQEQKPNANVLDRTRKPNALNSFSKSSSSADDGCNGILMILLCIFLPPVAIYIVEKTTVRFWIALICCLLTGGALGYVYLGGFWLVAVILAFMAYLG